MIIRFKAYGTPAPKGSMKAFLPRGSRFPVVVHDNAKTRPWAALVKDAARQSLGDQITLALAFGPLSLQVDFYMPRPKSLPKKVTAHTKKPDLDKLVRAVKDALTGVVWHDDSQVVELQASKSYAAAGTMPRAEIVVYSKGEIENV